MNMLNKNVMQSLKQVIELLPESLEESRETCSIMSEGNYDESAIICTKTSLLALAKKLIEIVYYASCDEKKLIYYERDKTGDVVFSAIGDIKYLFDESADVWPVCIMMAENDDDARSIIDSFMPAK